MKIYTTLKLIKAAHPCAEGLQDFLQRIGVDCPENRRIYASDALKAAAPLSSLIWGLGTVPKTQKAYVKKLLVAFACDCAERVLPIFERERPGDKSPRKAIETARVVGKVSAHVAYAAYVADAAACTAARTAAYASACTAARTAAYAARTAAYVADAAAYAADAAAYATYATYATYAAAFVADAAREAEEAWQRWRLAEYLSGNLDLEKKRKSGNASG